MSMYRKLTTMAAVAVLGLGLAACGGGGDSTPTASNGDTMPTPDPAIAERAAIGTAITTAQTAVNAVDNDSTDAEVSAADTAIGNARTAIANAANVPAEEKAANTRTVNALSTQLSGAKMARNDAIGERMKAGAKDAEALFTGMDVDRGADGTADLTVSVDAMTVTDKYGGSASIAQATDGTTFLNPAPAGAVDAVKATATAVPALGDWKGTELAGSNTAGTISSTAIVYTDVEDDEQMPFDEVYGTSSDLTIDADTSGDAHVKLIMASAFDHKGVKDHAPGAGTGDDQVTVRFSGTFQGAPGQYQCTADSANDCVSHEDDNGIRLTGAGTPVAAWTFVPNPGAMVKVADATYLYFGWWLHQDSTGPEADAFHGVTGTGLTAIVEADFTALSGTATYKGGAAGKYAVDPIVPGTYAHGGHWTADATLTADFGTEANNGTISGMISDFHNGDGAHMDWSVALGATVLSAGGVFDTNTDTTGDTMDNAVVWTMNGEAAPSSGAWSGNLRDQGSNNVPNAATGEFSATYSEGGHTIGHMVGGFGAHVEE